MRTILEAFKAEVGYPVSEGYLINRLLSRGLCPDEVCTAEVLRGNAFLGTMADTLIGIVRMPNIQEGDMRIDLTDKSLLIKQANSIYRQLGERVVGEDEKPKPMVTIGW